MRLSDKEFIELWQSLRSAVKVAAVTGVDIRNVHSRRRSMEQKYHIKLEADDVKSKLHANRQTAHNHEARTSLGLRDGVVLVFSDAHFWPGIRTTAFKGLLWAIKELQPKAIICNGDAFDGASISRFPRIGWDSKPSVLQELEACSSALSEIEKVANQRAKLVWTLGNHDARFENRLSANASEYEGVLGFTLKDHFPKWTSCWSCWPTENVVVKHRFKGGIHATHANTVQSGKTMVTGHLHSLKVTPWSDYAERPRWGVDTGTLADVNGPQFTDYLEDSPTNWRSGFAVLTLHKGELLWPEVVHRFADDVVEFRGKLIDVRKY